VSVNPADLSGTKRLALHTQEVRAWMDQNFDQKVSRQRSQADTAKLITTFALAFAATLLGTALQVPNTSPALDLTATVLLGAAFIVTLIVIWLDNVVEPDSAWLATRLARPMIVEDVIDKLVELENMRDQINENWIQGTKIASQVQLLLAGGSSLISLVALLSTHT
jgi:hypothetical protein